MNKETILLIVIIIFCMIYLSYYYKEHECYINYQTKPYNYWMNGADPLVYYQMPVYRQPYMYPYKYNTTYPTEYMTYYDLIFGTSAS